MVLPRPEDGVHLSWMYKLLRAIADDAYLVAQLRFKGGTCAAMRGFLPRFSVDVDFDLPDFEQVPLVREHLERVFEEIELKIDEQSKRFPQYFLKYPSEPNRRSNLKIDVSGPPPEHNRYEPVRFTDIDRLLNCQTLPTMVANKMIAVLDRPKRKGAIAARDVYDLHHFLFHGYPYDADIITERTGKSAQDQLQEVMEFLDAHFTQTNLDQDLNFLLPGENFHRIRKILKSETLMLIRTELERLRTSR